MIWGFLAKNLRTLRLAQHFSPPIKKPKSLRLSRTLAEGVLSEGLNGYESALWKRNYWHHIHNITEWWSVVVVCVH